MDSSLRALLVIDPPTERLAGRVRLGAPGAVYNVTYYVLR